MDLKPTHQSMEQRIKVVGAERVLNHVDFPKSVIDQISARMLAGLVLIISTQGFGDETDHDTDFIVLTQNRHTRYLKWGDRLRTATVANGVLFSRTSEFL